MKFKNNKGESLEISILGWEHPNEDWLMIKVKGCDEKGSWEGKDPSLMFEEALELSEWLISLNSFQNSKLEFLEPELEFHFQEGNLCIYLEWKLRPPWKPSNANSDERYGLCFEVTLNELRAQIKNWNASLKKISP